MFIAGNLNNNKNGFNRCSTTLNETTNVIVDRLLWYNNFRLCYRWRRIKIGAVSCHWLSKVNYFPIAVFHISILTSVDMFPLTFKNRLRNSERKKQPVLVTISTKKALSICFTGCAMLEQFLVMYVQIFIMPYESVFR